MSERKGIEGSRMRAQPGQHTTKKRGYMRDHFSKAPGAIELNGAHAMRFRKGNRKTQASPSQVLGKADVKKKGKQSRTRIQSSDVRKQQKKKPK
jgi:hypothetical protein